KEPEAFHQRTGARLIRCAEPNYELGTVALGVALANPLAEETGPDLVRHIKPAPSIHDIFPWGELVIQAPLLGPVSRFLFGMRAGADIGVKALRVELKAFSWLNDLVQAKLDSQKKALHERSKVIGTSWSSRVAWSVPLRTIAAAAPASTVITSLSGDAPVESTSRSGSARTKKQPIINFATPMARDGSLPHEIDGFLTSLRSEPTLERHFPLIDVAGLRAATARKDSHPLASYSVICLPRADASRTIAAR